MGAAVQGKSSFEPPGFCANSRFHLVTSARINRALSSSPVQVRNLSNHLVCSGLAFSEGSRPVEMNNLAIPHLDALQPYEVNPVLSHLAFAPAFISTLSL